jgi:hypothetical protein
MNVEHSILSRFFGIALMRKAVWQARILNYDCTLSIISEPPPFLHNTYRYLGGHSKERYGMID